MFYAVDILFNFFTTFIDSSGDEEFSKKRIVIHYLKNAFIFDLVSAIPIGELYELTNEKITQGEGLIILINLFKVNRVVRIGRLLRFTRTKDNVKVLMRLGMIILYILLWVHLTSCLWFYIIKQKEEWVPTTDYLTGKSELFTNSTLAKKYFTVLYHGV